jgi:hypothetical protein
MSAYTHITLAGRCWPGPFWPSAWVPLPQPSAFTLPAAPAAIQQATTEIYAHVPPTRLQEAYQRYHPRA